MHVFGDEGDPDPRDGVHAKAPDDLHMGMTASQQHQILQCQAMVDVTKGPDEGPFYEKAICPSGSVLSFSFGVQHNIYINYLMYTFQGHERGPGSVLGSTLVKDP